MSIFQNLVNNISYALNKKKMKELKSKQSQIKELNQQLICINSELKEKNEEIKTLNLEIIKTLENHNSHQQNLHAKRAGLKSGFQYKMKIKSDISNTEQKQKDLNIQQEKYQNDLKKNQAELTKINNTILFYNNIQTTTILGFITSLLISLCYILLTINPNLLFNNPTNYIVYSSTLGFLILASTIITFFFDKILHKKLELEKLNFYSYLFPILLIANILIASMPLNSVKNFILFVLYLLFTISIFTVLIKNKETFKKNKNYCFPLDFTIFNLPFVNFTAVTMINVNFINNDILSLIIKIIYTISVIVYITLFIWEAITNWNKGKEFKHYIFLTISILLLFSFILCAILNFIPNVPQAIEIIAGIGGFISLFSPLYHGFKKATAKNNIENINNE